MDFVSVKASSEVIKVLYRLASRLIRLVSTSLEVPSALSLVLALSKSSLSRITS
jgi:hypothetical protein